MCCSMIFWKCVKCSLVVFIVRMKRNKLENAHIRQWPMVDSSNLMVTRADLKILHEKENILSGFTIRPCQLEPKGAKRVDTPPRAYIKFKLIVKKHSKVIIIIIIRYVGTYLKY